MALRNYRKAVPILVELTKDCNPMIRRQSVNALGKLKDVDGFESIKSACEDLDPHVRSSAFYALEEMNLRVPLNVLKKGMKDSDLNVRRSAIHAASKSDSYEIIPELQLIFDECEPDLAWNALYSIRELHSPQESCLLPWLCGYRFTKKGKDAFTLIQHIQYNCKFYNYEIFHSPSSKPQVIEQSPQATTINQYPNATEIKIFENVQTYHASSPRDPPL
jgi:hypothetical protein